MSLVVVSGKRYDEKVDIFSFGIVLCEVRTWNRSQLSDDEFIGRMSVGERFVYDV